MRRKCQSGRYALILTDIVVVRRIWSSYGELCADLDMGIIGNLAHVPRSKAVRISEVLALSGIGSTVQISVKVEFFSRIVLMDILTITR